MSARAALLGRLIDHAPTFPPASLPPDEALAEDRRARESDEAWMLARLAWPASRLEELGNEQRALTLILDTSGARHRTWPDPRVEAVETRFDGDPAELVDAAPEIYIELPPDGDLDRLAELGLRAKIRCGGERVPTVDELAGFVRGCRKLELAFKATAGLHHAVRREDEHGFLNLLAASVFCDEEAALSEEDAEAFTLTSETFSWRDHTSGADEIALARGLFVGFGSCSFAEPVEELRTLGLL